MLSPQLEKRLHKDVPSNVIRAMNYEPPYLILLLFPAWSQSLPRLKRDLKNYFNIEFYWTIDLDTWLLMTATEYNDTKYKVFGDGYCTKL
jgi:hypothetical protein